MKGRGKGGVRDVQILNSAAISFRGEKIHMRKLQGKMLKDSLLKSENMKKKLSGFHFLNIGIQMGYRFIQQNIFFSHSVNKLCFGTVRETRTKKELK